MALLLEYEFRTLPADKQIDTEPFLEAVTRLPPFFGEWPPRSPGRGEGRLQGGQRCSVIAAAAGEGERTASAP